MDYLTLEYNGDVAVVGLNRPQKRNAISDAFIEELNDVITEVEARAKAAVIHGHGPHFCAGLDLAEHVKKTPFEGVHGSRRWHEVFARIQRGKLPWFAALHGAVVGGGLELASSVHVRVADRTAFFALPEGQRGIFVGGGASVRSARLMGVSRMTDLMLTGRSVDADTAERWGIANYVVDAGEALAKAIELAKHAATNAEISTYAIIHALPRIADMGSDDGLFVESFIASFTATSPEAEARLNAFLSKKAGKVTNPNG
ncbi:MAG: crotonase/enoyl-CoA hydratase family protein [Proteobacteria bacterium]|uniref:crotonase/enoyl-CoA hydratase family protein n=1 Tax=Pararhodobacter TaxID=1097465 RepID=UPI002AFF5DEE|nr:crotonase/enoyl-CoA hydratase family protein [Pararhodobacter sp.]MCA0203098.1 crotonase/enoyl-CoA hydratase family protein [Pseudomonadota bacterium]